MIGQDESKCQRCESTSILSMGAKCSDRCSMAFDDEDGVGYVPANLNVGEGDYIAIDYCLDCGQMQGDFPITRESVVAAIRGM